MSEGRRVKKLIEAGTAALRAADYSRVERIGKDLLSVAADDDFARARGYNFVGNARLQLGDGDGAEANYQKALEIFRRLGDETWVATVLMNLGIVAVEINMDVTEGRRLYDITLPLMRKHGDPFRIALTLGNFAEISRLEGDYAQALAYADESYRIFTEINEPEWAAWRLITIAHVHSILREYPTAIELLRRAYSGLAEGANPAWLAVYFDVWFFLAVELKCHEGAVRLAGFCDRMRTQRNVPRLSSLMPWYVPSLERLRKTLSENRYAELRSEGAHFSLTEANSETQSITL